MTDMMYIYNNNQIIDWLQKLPTDKCERIEDQDQEDHVIKFLIFL